MSLFGNKKNNKNESLHTLSETEIQKKLYGGVLPGGRAGLKREEEKKAPQSLKDEVKEIQKPASEPAQSSTAVAPQPSKPHKTEKLASEPTLDLFEQANEEEPEVVEESPVNQFDEVEEARETSQPITEKVSSVQREKIQQWVKKENKIVEETPKSTTPTSSVKPTSVYRPERVPGHEPAEKSSNAVAEGAGKAVKVFFQTIIGFFGVLLAGTISFFLKIDFRKPQIRKLFYWLGAVAILAGLLIAIHFLNVKRENAMNGKVPVASSSESKNASASTTERQQESSQKSSTTEVSSNSARQVQDSNVSSESTSAASTQLQTAESSEENTGADVQPTPSAEKSYVIQVATYAVKSDAERIVERFSEAGIQSFVKSLKRPSGKLYYCVFLGTFPDYSTAEEALSDFKRTDSARPYQDSFVRRI